MSVHLPSQLGIIIRKSPRTLAAIVHLRQANRRFPRNEDAHLAGFWMAGSSQDAQAKCEDLVKEFGLQVGVDFVPTGGVDEGVCGPMPDWLQEDEGGAILFSVPGTAGPARAVPRLTWAQQRAIERRQQRIETLASRRAGDAAALRRWPGLSDGLLDEFLGDCWALAEFVEGSRTGGPARSWVESTFPGKTWHIPVHNGYETELRDALRTWYRDGPSNHALARVRRRAGEYMVALEGGAARGTVDITCFEAWRRRFAGKSFEPAA